MPRRILLIALILFMIVAIFPFNLIPSRAQNTITLSLAVPSQQANTFNDKVIAAFEADNPGIKLNIVKADAGIPPAAQDLEKHLDAVEKYVQTADVLYVDTFNMSPEAARAGYFLDLAPLVLEDKTLNSDDFFPSIWQSFQWEKGIWALPVSADAIVLIYKPADFDKAGLPYPSDQWTIDDLENAIRTLAVKDSDGKITSTGMNVGPLLLPYLLRMANSEKLYDENVIPNTPKLDTATNQALLERWKKLEDEGYIGQGINSAPLEINAAISILFRGVDNPDEKRAGSLIFGKAGLSTQGLAVSAGTQYPEQAYKLAAWLTNRAEIITTGFASTPARQSLLGKKGADSAIELNVTPEIQALIDQAVQKGIPLSEMRYVDYLGLAYNKMKTDKLDAVTALQNAEAAAIKAQSDAAARKDKLALVVATPVPAAETNGKPALKFGIMAIGGFGGGGSYPNKDQWQKAVADFTQANPDVGTIAIDRIAAGGGGGGSGLKRIAQDYDCFYLPYNAVQGTDFTALLSLDPYLSADSTFDKADMVGGILNAVTRDNKVYGLPVDIQPNVLKYNTETFAKAGVAEPQGIWTTDMFVDTLKQLKPTAKDDAPFVPTNTFGSYILSLVASFGGLPLDYRTNPPTINYTDPKTVDAIRQVLDLAKQGYIRYVKLGDLTLSDFSILPPGGAITQESLGAFALQRVFSQVTSNDPKFKFTIYPKGTTFTAVTYNLGALYISATSQNPEGCYRFLSSIAQNVTLFSSMPTRRSLLNDPALVTAQGQAIVDVYKTIDTLLQDPNTVAIPISLLSGNNLSIFYNIWLYRALDAYVLNDKDLEASLADAEQQSKTFQDCQATLPPLDSSSTEAQKTYLRAFRDCAVKADPTLKSLFDMLKLD